MFAAAAGRADIVAALLKAGGDVNARNNVGLTAMKIAADTGRAEVIALLKEYGASMS